MRAIEYFRMNADRLDDWTSEGVSGADVREILGEIDQLRTALDRIANDPGGYPAEDVVDIMRETARRALSARQ